MKKLVMCLVVGAVLGAGAAYADSSVCFCGHSHDSGRSASVPLATTSGCGPLATATGAVSTAYGAGETCMEAVGATAVAPLQVAKDAINSVCRGLSGGDTLFWD